MTIQDKIITVIICILGAAALGYWLPDNALHGVILYFLLLINSKTYFKEDQ